MKGNNILVLFPIDERQRKIIECVSPNSSYVYKSKEDVDKETVEQAEIIIGNLPPEMLVNSNNLKWLQLNNAGSADIFSRG